MKSPICVDIFKTMDDLEADIPLGIADMWPPKEVVKNFTTRLRSIRTRIA